MIKTTGSAFTNFVRDEYTTLAEVNDRIFSTSIDLTYTFAPISIPRPADGEGKIFDAPFTGDAAKGTPWDGDALAAATREITLEVFALDESASVQVCLRCKPPLLTLTLLFCVRVQATLHKMGQRIIAENKHITTVTYKLPNVHYVPVDMKYIGVDNISPYVLPPYWYSDNLTPTLTCPVLRRRCSSRSRRRGMIPCQRSDVFGCVSDQGRTVVSSLPPSRGSRVARS